jgi:hypothetical protein
VVLDFIARYGIIGPYMGFDTGRPETVAHILSVPEGGVPDGGRFFKFSVRDYRIESGLQDHKKQKIV